MDFDEVSMRRYRYKKKLTFPEYFRYIFVFSFSSMINLLNYIKAFLLSALILSTGTGYTMSKMECSKSGKYKVSFGSIAGCCEKNKKLPCSVQRSCCKITSTYFHALPLLSLKKNDSVASHQYPVTDALFFQSIIFCFESKINNYSSFYSSPPLLPGGLFILNSALLI
jgi:hypothetical protein